MLDINPDYMRRGLRDWKERKLEAIARAAAARAEAALNPILAEEPAVAAQPVPSTDTAQPVLSTDTAQPVQARTSKVFTPRHVRSKTASVHAGRKPARNLHKARA